MATNGLDCYRDILQLPSPTREENKVLIDKAVTGGLEEKWELVIRNIKLVFYLLNL